MADMSIAAQYEALSKLLQPTSEGETLRMETSNGSDQTQSVAHNTYVQLQDVMGPEANKASQARARLRHGHWLIQYIAQPRLLNQVGEVMAQTCSTAYGQTLRWRIKRLLALRKTKGRPPGDLARLLISW